MSRLAFVAVVVGFVSACGTYQPPRIAPPDMKGKAVPDCGQPDDMSKGQVDSTQRACRTGRPSPYRREIRIS